MTIKELVEKIANSPSEKLFEMRAIDPRTRAYQLEALLTDWVRELVGKKERFLTLKYDPCGGLKQSIRDVDRSTENWNRGVRNALRLNILDKAGTSFAKNKYIKQESR